MINKKASDSQENMEFPKSCCAANLVFIRKLIPDKIKFPIWK